MDVVGGQRGVAGEILGDVPGVARQGPVAVERAGAGVEVFQPLEFVKGENALTDIPRVRDGDNLISLNVQRLAPGQEIAFTIDVDDTMGGREITVSDAEIKGAMVRFVSGSIQSEAAFDRRANALLKMSGCD